MEGGCVCFRRGEERRGESERTREKEAERESKTDRKRQTEGKWAGEYLSEFEGSGYLAHHFPDGVQ